MKNKILVLVLTLALMAVVFTGCTSEEAPVDEGNLPAGDVAGEQGDLVDGMYLVKYPVTDHADMSMAILEVENGNVSKLDYNEYLVDSGEPKSNDNYPYAEGIQIIADLNTQFNDKKDIDAVDFDALSGATSTKGKFKDAVMDLVEKAKAGETYTPVYKDGIYQAKSEEASHGWLSEVELVVEYGQIVGINYQEIAVEASEGVEIGDVKSTENYEYPVPFEVASAMQKLIIDKNGTEDLDVDGLTGATSTRTTIIELVDKALSEAK